jgi:MFS family permease
MTPSAYAKSGAAEASQESAYPRPRYAWYVLGVLTLVYIFSFLDRQILNLLVAPIRRDLHVTDTQISLLSGFTFAIFYVAFGIPLGRVADSRNRTRLITGGFAAWSLFTAACGMAGSFGQLALMRMGVGIGEATLSPAAYSLISDYFPPRRRAFAQGIYNMGIYVGSGIALVLGGIVTGIVSRRADYTIPLLGTVRSWQVIFLVIGVVGVLVVPIMLTVREPVRQNAGRRAATSIPLGEVVAYVRQNFATYSRHNLGIAMLSFSS